MITLKNNVFIYKGRLKLNFVEKLKKKKKLVDEYFAIGRSLMLKWL